MATHPAWHSTASKRAQAAVLCAALSLMASTGTALAQFIADPKTENAVFVDESPAASDAIARAAEHVAAGNPEQAVRTLQKVLDERANEFVVSASDANLFEPVRERVHAMLLANPRLMSKYREMMGASALQMLDAGKFEELERTRLMTPQGLTGSLRLARRRVLDGEFDGAAITVLQLADHPDRAAEAKNVAEAAALVARYTARGPVRTRLNALLGDAAAPEVEALATADAKGRPSLGDGSPTPVVDDLVNQALGTGVFGDTSFPIQPQRWAGDESALALLPAFAREMRCWPAVGERAVFFSNGQTVTALDRVSMRRLWSVPAADLLKLPTDEQDRVNGGVRIPPQAAREEVVQPALAAGESLVVAVVGRDYDSLSQTEGIEHLVGFDARTGSVRYTVPLRSLDEQLTDCYSRGPLMTDGRVVVVHMLKRQNQRRLIASVLVGVEATTGRHLWTRVVGSAGVLPFTRMGSLTDGTSAANGIVYRYDRLGAVGAYTIAEGRPLWVRRIGSKVSLESNQEPEPWLMHRPLVTPAGVIVMTPDHDEVLVLDPASGFVTSRRKTAELGEPEYLTATPTHLVAVARMQLATVRLDQIETGPPKFSGRLGGSLGIRGRVTAAGDQIVVPLATGVSVLNAETPARGARTVTLDAPGSPLSLPEGLLVVDDARAHMYCTWAVAAAHLREQIAASPADAGPATELLVLAERASKPEEMLPAADSALAALGRPGTEADAARAVENRSTLVATLLRSVNRSIGQKVDQGGAKLDDAGVDGAIERAGRAAQTPGDRVAVLLATGDAQESRQKWPEAVDAYQRVLTDEALASTGAPGSRNGMTASVAAVERIARVVRAGGRASYAAFDARFNQDLAALGPQDAAPVEKLESLAATYPLARQLPALWLSIADRYAATGTLQSKRAQARALERGVQAAERGGPGDADPVVAGELNGSLIRNLLDRTLLAAAADALSRAQSHFPSAALTVNGAPMTAEDVRGLIQRDMASARRWPRVGAPRDGRAPQVIDGWVLMEPLIRATGGTGAGAGAGNSPFIVLHKGDDKRTQVALFGLKQGQLAGEAAEGAAGALTELWYSQSGSDPWTLVRTDARGALFFVGEQNGGRLVRVDAESGKVAWQTEPFGTLFPTDPPARFGGNGGAAQRTSIGGELRSTAEIVLATDDRTVCMVERAGRCAAVDADSGQVLWTSRLAVTRIADATVSGGQLIAVGEYAQPQPDNKVDRIALVDARAGTPLAVAAAPLTGVRYMRTTSRGDLVLGAGGTIVAINAADLETGKPAWTLTGHRAADAWEAWLLDDRLFLLGDDRTLWEVPASSGLAPAKPIDVQGRLDSRTAIAVWQTANGTVAFATGRGLALIDGKGSLMGADAVNASEGTVMPAVIEGGALLLTPSPQRQSGMMMMGEGNGGSSAPWNLYRLDTAGAQMLSMTPVAFATPPLRMAVIDGRIAVSTSSGTVVIDAPAEAK
jgi:outer membrane protein assembly factor BamB